MLKEQRAQISIEMVIIFAAIVEGSIQVRAAVSGPSPHLEGLFLSDDGFSTGHNFVKGVDNQLVIR